MEKSVFTQEYSQFLTRLREARKQAGVTQAQLAERMRTSQSFISKCERGERRIDVIELKHFCDALEVPFEIFIMAFICDLEKTRSSA